jgi:hypothetical protein
MIFSIKLLFYKYDFFKVLILPLSINLIHTLKRIIFLMLLNIQYDFIHKNSFIFLGHH